MGRRRRGDRHRLDEWIVEDPLEIGGRGGPGVGRGDTVGPVDIEVADVGQTRRRVCRGIPGEVGSPVPGADHGDAQYSGRSALVADRPERWILERHVRVHGFLVVHLHRSSAFF